MLSVLHDATTSTQKLGNITSPGGGEVTGDLPPPGNHPPRWENLGIMLPGRKYDGEGEPTIPMVLPIFGWT